jgi:hypothetical protein
MSTLRTITGFKERLAGGGARSNLFEVEIPTFPTSIASSWNVAPGEESETFKFLCKTASLPASTIASIDVPFRGRTLKVAGDRSFDVWNVTIINDENFKLRTAFERWMNHMNKLENATGATNPSSYMVDAYVHQLGRGAGTKESINNSNILNSSAITPLRTYKFNSIFPTNVSAIDLSYDSENSIEEYSVEFQVLYWTAGQGPTNGSDATNVIIN